MTTPEAVSLSDVPHIHDWLTWATFHRAPTGPSPNHTTFVVFVCQQAGCSAVSVFPRSNFALCTHAFQQQFLTAAAAAGRRLIDVNDTALEWPSVDDPDGRIGRSG